jgi:peptidyl-prolyl cis-trans isomerase SurA
VPEFEAQLAKMSPGDMSDPVRTAFGWHLIELLDVREKDASEEASLNEAYGQVRSRKLQQETERWLLQLRDEAFVDYRS